jgi:oligosaccharide repeat unit polymerase
MFFVFSHVLERGVYFLEIAIYILSSVIFGFFIVRNIRRNDINAFNIFLIMILFAYLFVPTLVFIFGGNYQKRFELVGYIFQADLLERLKALLYIVIFTVCAMFAYCLMNPAKHAMAYADEKINSGIYRKAKIYVIVLSIIGLIGFFYMVYTFGGINNLLQYSGSSRGEGDYKIASGSMLAYAILASKALLGCICPLVVLYELKPKKSTIVFGVILICTGIIILIYNAGKLPAIIFFLPMLLYFVDKKRSKRKNKAFIYLLIGLVVFLAMQEMDNIFYYLRYGVFLSSFTADYNFMDKVMAIINSFTYPFSNLLFADKMNAYFGMRFGVDYILPFVNILPHSVLNAVGLTEINTLYNQTSAYYHALNPGSTGGVPNDIITVAIRQLSLPGIIIIGSSVGLLLKYLDGIIVEINELGSQFRYLIYTNYMVVVIFLFLEPYSAIMAYLSIIVLLFLTKSIHKLGSNHRLQKMSLNREWLRSLLFMRRKI